ncbi:chromate transporter [Pedobacter chinensis]|uniref:Chromate transporter n=1 Tax=Pedobacter chinensis TaxID=2282421 RepID=A0A369Q3J9_9SPHI|nr:chromate efflux transporter [Pedobacter chinensis]RDC57827.1 chromate transporter [Pedobacter chinensis]
MEPEQKPLKDLAKLFFKLGCIGFGGPAVHIAMMEDEVVRKRKWFSSEYFLDMVSATNLIPGPNSTEMTMHIGHERAGWRGLLVAGLCFIFPAVMITAVFAWAHQQYGKLPQVTPFIYGIKPAVISIIVSTMISLGKKALKTVELGVIGIIAAGLAIYGFNEIYILFGGGLIGALIYMAKSTRQSLNSFAPVALLQIGMTWTDKFDWRLFAIFLKIGAILYGSGYVLFAFLDTELVKTGLLSKQELVDAIAVGQLTPGPVFSSATFIGWQIGGLPGAIAATIGIFLPSFLFVFFLNPLLPKLRKSKVMSAFLDSVNVVSIAVILAICIEMGQTSITDWRTTVIAIASFAVTSWFKKINSAFIIAGGSILGYLLWVTFPI